MILMEPQEQDSWMFTLYLL